MGDKMRGTAEELAGKAKSAVADATDNERLQGEGMVDQAQGKSQQAKGGLKDKLDDLGDKIGDAADTVRDKVAGAADRTPAAGERGAGQMGTRSGQTTVKAEDLADDRPNRTRA